MRPFAFLRVHRRLTMLLTAAALVVLSVLGLLDAHGVSVAAVGTGAVYLKNLPAPNTFRIDAVTFAQETSRNRKMYPAVSAAGYGQAVAQKVDATGVVGRLLVVVKATFTNGGVAAPTQTSQWPWNLVKSLTVAANGINNLFYCDGLDLRALQRVRNPFFFDRESAFAIGAGANTVWSATLLYEIPLAFDDESLMGAVFAQTQDTTLTVSVQLANSADLWSANAAALTANTVQVTCEFYSIPYEDTSNGRIAIIPDLRRMHGFYAQNAPLAGTSYSPLMRVNGILCRVLQRGDNAANVAGDVDWSALATDHQFNYGSNVVPYDVSGQIQRMENQKDYGDKLLPAADFVSGAVNYIADDLVRDNALRDVVHLMGVTQPQLINIFNGLVVSNGNNSVVRTVQEHMVAGA